MSRDTRHGYGYRVSAIQCRENRNLTVDAPGGAEGLKALVKLATQQKEREIILRVLEQCDWRKSAAAKQLQISRPTLDQKVRTHGLTPYINKGRER